MRRFAFKLEQLLEVRAYGEKLAKARLAEKAGACARLQQSLEDNARATIVAGRERFRPGGTLSDFRAGEMYAVRLQKERERLFKALAAAETEREAARLKYVEASRSMQLVEKLKERAEHDYYKFVSREEIKTMDDLASNARIRAGAGSL